MVCLIDKNKAIHQPHRIYFILCLMIGILFLNNFSLDAQIIKKNIPDKLVVLTFDDGPASHYSVVAPLLKKYGHTATFFVCEFPPNYADSSLYMNWRQIHQLHLMGFEIANHTKDHIPAGKVEKEKLIEQVSYIEDQCDAYNIPPPSTFAYPGYNLSLAAIKTLEDKSYYLARAGGSRAYDALTDHPMIIPSWATNNENKEEIMEALQQAKDGKIVILTLHGVPDIEHPWVDTNVNLFEYYLKYLKDHNYTTIRFKDLEQYIDVQKAGEEINIDLSKKYKND